MSQQPQQQSPITDKKGFFFVYHPFIVCIGLIAIALVQNKGIERFQAMQGASAATDKRTQLIQCYAKFGVTDPAIIAKLNALDNKQVNDLLFECNARLLGNGQKAG